MNSSTDIVRGFRQLHALVIGDAMLDSYLEGSASRLCAEGPVPVVRKTMEERLPGGAANTAANVRALGAEVTFVGVVGNDIAGITLRRALRERHIDDSGLVEDPEVSTLHKMRVLADGQYVVRFDAGEPGRLSREDQIQQAVEENFPRCDLIVISDYGYGVISRKLLLRLAELRMSRPVPLIIDSKNLLSLARVSATVITPNHLEAQLALEMGSNYDAGMAVEKVKQMGAQLLEIIPAEWAAITMAAEGVVLAGRDGTAQHFPAHRVAHPADVGAGDSFTAALSLALATGASVPIATEIAVAASGIAVTRARTAVVQHQELLQRMSLESQPIAPSTVDVVAELDEARRNGKAIVFTNGVFDLLHAGHVHFLREARALGDVLVVGINSDASARRLKGENRPINSLRDRQALVAALDAVDYVVAFDEDTPEESIRTVRPHIHVKGGDYEGEPLPEAEAVREVGGRVEILPLSGNLSTSRVIERIISFALDEQLATRR